MESFSVINFNDINKVIQSIKNNAQLVISEENRQKLQEFYNSTLKLQHLFYLTQSSLRKSWGEFLEGVHMSRYMDKNQWTISFIPRDNKYFVTFKAGIMSNYEDSVVEHMGKDIKEFILKKASSFSKIAYQYFNALTGFKHDIQMNIVDGVGIYGCKNKQFYIEIPVEEIRESCLLGEEVSLEKLAETTDSLHKKYLSKNLLTKNDQDLCTNIFSLLCNTNKDFRNASIYHNFVLKMAEMEPKLEIGEYDEFEKETMDNTYTLGYMIANEDGDEIYVMKSYDEEEGDEDESREYTEWYKKTFDTHLELLRRVNMHFNEYFPIDLVETSIIKDDYHYAIIKCIPNGLKL